MGIERPGPQDKFYFYNSTFDPVRLIERNVVSNLTPTAGYLTNAFGVLVNPVFLPGILEDRAGQVEAPPIPANWHSDIAEFGAAIRAVELASHEFTMIELGCGWGCWMNITGAVARRRGLEVHLIGVEGDEGHVGFARESLQTNRFSPAEYKVHHGIAAPRDGVALFPVQAQAGASWGQEPRFDVKQAEAEKLIKSGKYNKLEQFTLERLADGAKRIDLLHVDIQGGEASLIPECLPYLNKRVAYLLIGTHSRQIEGALLDCLLNAGWVLEIERPAVLNVGQEVQVSVDGVQAWRNPRLLPDDQADKVDHSGKLSIKKSLKKMQAGNTYALSVEINNLTTTDWCGYGRYPIHISYHWQRINGNTEVFDGRRTLIEGSCVPAGKTVRQDATVVAPDSEGNYRLELTLVQEGVKWFSAPEFDVGIMDVHVTGNLA